MQMKSGNILVVDDERTTRMAISEALRQQGYQVAGAASGEEAVDLLEAEEFDAVILDLQMPGMHGIEVLSASDELAPDTSFIILTAYASTETAITALRSGATDYLQKPASLTQITAAVEKGLATRWERQNQQRVRTLLQQALTSLDAPPRPVVHLPSAKPTPAMQVGPLRLDPGRQEAAYQGTSLELTPVQFKLLYTFARQPNVILSYTELARSSHDLELEEADARTLLRTHLYRLSRKLGDVEDSPLQSVRGQGYILNISP